MGPILTAQLKTFFFKTSVVQHKPTRDKAGIELTGIDHRIIPGGP